MTEKEPQLDQDGKMINPHNPDFITKVPWYLGNSGPTLKHHAVQKSDHFLTLSEQDALINNKLSARKSIIQSQAKTVYRKGACKNCGAMTHKEKDCVERPRSSKKSAWKSGLDIAPDEVTLKLEDHGKVSYDAKRDQWKGYNPDEYNAIIEKHDRLEMERVKHNKIRKEMNRRETEEKHRRKKEEKEKKKTDRRSGVSTAGGETMKKPKSKSDSSVISKDDKTSSDAGANDNSDSDNNNQTDNLSNSDSDSDSDYGSDEEDEDDDIASDEEGGHIRSKDFVAKDEEARDFQGMMAPQGGIGGAGMRVTVRNLRLREDTPKYLRNLALDSAFYDPKSRAMRANPLPDENPEDLAFAGDNFIRYSGDAVKLAQNQLLCWEMQARGENIDVISNPSQAELTQRQYIEKKREFEQSKRAAILAAYSSDGKAPVAMDPRLRLGQTEQYVEYSRDGSRVTKGSGGTLNGGGGIVRTKYEEDIYQNNHTAVWGSYYNRARAVWGYSCCHSCMRNSYCTGMKGREANDAANSESMDAFQARKMLDNNSRLTANSSSSSNNNNLITKRSDIYGESSSTVNLDAERLQQAHMKAEQMKKQQDSSSSNSNNNRSVNVNSNGSNNNSISELDRKRGYNSMHSVDVTAEDMEVYRMKRVKGDDPMAALLDTDTLLEL